MFLEGRDGFGEQAGLGVDRFLERIDELHRLASGFECSEHIAGQGVGVHGVLPGTGHRHEGGANEGIHDLTAFIHG